MMRMAVLILFWYWVIPASLGIFCLYRHKYMTRDDAIGWVWFSVVVWIAALLFYQSVVGDKTK